MSDERELEEITLDEISGFKEKDPIRPSVGVPLVSILLLGGGVMVIGGISRGPMLEFVPYGATAFCLSFLALFFLRSRCGGRCPQCRQEWKLYCIARNKVFPEQEPIWVCRSCKLYFIWRSSE